MKERLVNNNFMLGRRTKDTIFALRKIMDKYVEKQKEPHLVFIYLEKSIRVQKGEL